MLVLLVERDAALVVRDALIVELAGRVAELEARLGRNSRNSSKPPSSDGLAKPAKPSPKSLRRVSGRPPGKQQGEQGFRLQPRAVPDAVRTHAPTDCRGCGADWASRACAWPVQWPLASLTLTAAIWAASGRLSSVK